ncbi:MAG: serine hydrolase [Phycisphaerales bacterium JB059]
MRMRSGWVTWLVSMVVSLTVWAWPGVSCAQEVDLTGVWEGEIELPGTSLPIEVAFERDGEGWGGRMSIEVQGLVGRELEGVTLEGRSIGFVLPGIPGDPTFEGEVAEDGERMGGAFTQGLLRATWFLEPVGLRAEAFAAELEAFGAWFETAREAWDVPGAAVCVVRGDEIVFSRGFGLRDREAGLGADEETLFGIGSCTKAFTTMLLGQLVEEGAIDWDDRVQEHLPEFALKERDRAAGMTVRDLVTHRSGLPRHDLAWYGNPEASRDELLAMMRHHEATAPIRSVWQYNNLMYMAAGMVVERVTGKSWEENIRERIFEPLGMERANTRIEALVSDPNHAKAYADFDGELRRVEYRRITAVGPAGSINASVEEMGAWMIAQLNGGAFGETRLVEEGQVAMMHRPQMLMPGGEGGVVTGLGSGLGWVVDLYRGHRRVHHSGGIDGFSTTVTLVPEDRLGIAVLTNASTGLAGVAAQHALDRLLGLEPQDWSGQSLAQIAQMKAQGKVAEASMEEARVADAPASHELGAYAGRYEHPGYGVIEVSLEDGALVAHVNRMEAPLEHWHYDVFRFGDSDDRVLRHQMVRFETALDGSIEGVRWAVEPSTEGVLFARRDRYRAEAGALEACAGVYNIMGVQRARVSVRGDHLEVRLPGQPVHVLIPSGPDEFEIKGLSGYRVEFNRDESGGVEALTFRQPNGVFRGERVEE